MKTKYFLDEKEVSSQIVHICDEERAEILENEIRYYLKQNPDKHNNYLRNVRDIVCYSVVNRGKIWYDTLDATQLSELKAWYDAWLSVTETKIMPEKPEWLK